MLEKTGVPTPEQIQSVFPSAERLNKGPAAIIECFQRIPCNPCQKACRMGAIQAFSDINDLPVMDFDKCNGCGLCISQCPGLAIMVVDWRYSSYEFLLRIPYEFTPLPKQGDTVRAVDREGKYVCDARVDSVWILKNKTNIVSLVMPKDENINALYRVKHFNIKGDVLSVENEADVCINGPSIICRCSDIDVNQIREYINQGFTTIDEIKHVSRLGMGPCQGRNCIPLVLAELSRATGRAAAELHPGTYRPVVRSVNLGAVASSGGNGGEYR
jgi:Fe-S-cluster-containing hydrogenase component 2/bacterioferritin-associated ferredoxin